MTVVQDEGSSWTPSWKVVSINEIEDIVRTGREGAYRVKWTEQLELENTIQIKLPGIPEPVSVISPKMLNARFPSRIRMQFHPSWQKLRDDLYDRTKTDYTHRELFQISRYDSILWRATGLYLEIPNGGEPGIWEGDFDGLGGCSEHKEFWEQDGEKYDIWARWGNLLQDLISGELRDLIDDEKFSRSYDGKPPDIEATLQLLTGRVKNKVAMLDEWAD